MVSLERHQAQHVLVLLWDQEEKEEEEEEEDTAFSSSSISRFSSELYHVLAMYAMIPAVLSLFVENGDYVDAGDQGIMFEYEDDMAPTHWMGHVWEETFAVACAWLVLLLRCILRCVPFASRQARVARHLDGWFCWFVASHCVPFFVGRLGNAWFDSGYMYCVSYGLRYVWPLVSDSHLFVVA